MSLFDYKQGRLIAAQGFTFYALIQAAMRQADTDNLAKLRFEFPEVHREIQERYNAPDGRHPGEEET